jgi:hypothetical protein
MSAANSSSGSASSSTWPRAIPGPFVIRRLSKVEYGNTLRDLYGVDPSIADSLPEEVVGEGYLNSISPMQSELFLDIANKVIAQVVAPEGQAAH